MTRVIINADDFGINTDVTHKTEELIERGLISSTTIMANGNCLEEVASFARQHPEVSYGIHLCLDEYDSLTKNPKLKKQGIIDNDGAFIKGAVFTCGCYDEALKNALYEELSAQIERLQSLGIKLSHADSHHLAHTRLKELQPLFFALFDKYGIKKTRIGEVYSIKEMIRSHIGGQKSISNNVDKSEHRDIVSIEQPSKLQRAINLLNTIRTQKCINKRYRNRYKTPDYFFFYSSLLEKSTSKCKAIFDSVVELMCHPGHPSEEYQKEIRCIEKEALREKIDYELISYNEL